MAESNRIRFIETMTGDAWFDQYYELYTWRCNNPTGMPILKRRSILIRVDKKLYSAVEVIKSGVTSYYRKTHIIMFVFISDEEEVRFVLAGRGKYSWLGTNLMAEFKSRNFLEG